MLVRNAVAEFLNVRFRSTLRKAILVGVVLTVLAGAFSLLFPNAPNYLFLPGMMLVYVVTGGVHGYASGVYLPSLPLWYALGGLADAAIYSTLVFMVLRGLHRMKTKRSL